VKKTIDGEKFDREVKVNIQKSYPILCWSWFWCFVIISIPTLACFVGAICLIVFKNSPVSALLFLIGIVMLLGLIAFIKQKYPKRPKTFQIQMNNWEEEEILVPFSELSNYLRGIPKPKDETKTKEVLKVIDSNSNQSWILQVSYWVFIVVSFSLLNLITSLNFN